ncbi:MAG: DoxX protein [Cyanobacteriota bacterium]|nr:DoxX protein [Cyanobacteriota bacterium]
MTNNEKKLQISLAIMRFSMAAFFLIWSVEKIIDPESTQGIFKTFYFIDLPSYASSILGILQTLIVLVFAVGLFKTWSYGALLGMHFVSVLSTYERLLNPYTRPNNLFWAAVPALGALIALFLLRDSDRFLTLNFPKPKNNFNDD